MSKTVMLFSFINNVAKIHVFSIRKTLFLIFFIFSQLVVTQRKKSSNQWKEKYFSLHIYIKKGKVLKKIAIFVLAMAILAPHAFGQDLVDVIAQTVTRDYEVGMMQTCGFFTIDDYGLTFFVSGMFNGDTLTVRTKSVKDECGRLTYRFDDGSVLGVARDGNTGECVSVLDVDPRNTMYGGIRLIFFNNACSRFRTKE